MKKMKGGHEENADEEEENADEGEMTEEELIEMRNKGNGSLHLPSRPYERDPPLEISDDENSDDEDEEDEIKIEDFQEELNPEED